jgi:hypothetical protein
LLHYGTVTRAPKTKSPGMTAGAFLTCTAGKLSGGGARPPPLRGRFFRDQDATAEPHFTRGFSALAQNKVESATDAVRRTERIDGVSHRFDRFLRRASRLVRARLDFAPRSSRMIVVEQFALFTLSYGH